MSRFRDDLADWSPPRRLSGGIFLYGPSSLSAWPRQTIPARPPVTLLFGNDATTSGPMGGTGDGVAVANRNRRARAGVR